MPYDIGPVIGIEGEKEFRNSIMQIKDNMKTLGTEMKAVASQFDKNDNSITSLSAKNTVLNKQIEEQKTHLSQLEKGLKAAADKYGENDKVTQGWQRSVNEATAKLNTMERELKNNTETMNKAKNPADNLGKEIKKVGDNADKAGQHTLKLGDIIKGNLISQAIISGVKNLANSFVGLAKDALDSADSVQQLADKTGMSAEAVQEWQYVGDTLGASIEDITGAQSKLTKSMSAAAGGSKAQVEAFKALGVSIKDSNGHLKDSKVVMTEAFGALGKVGNETERDALSMKIFGKSAMDLNPLIKAGSDEIARLSDEAKKSGAVMSNEAVSGLDNFGDSIGQVKQSLVGMAGSILEQVMPNLQGLMDKVKAFSQAVQDGQSPIQVLRDLITNSFGPSAGQTFANLSSAVSTLKDGILKFKPIISDVFNYLLTIVLPKLSAFAAENAPNIKQIFSDIAAILVKIRPLLQELNSTLLSEAIQNFSDLLTVVSGVTGALNDLLNFNWSSLGTKLKSIVNPLGSLAQTLNIVKNPIGALGSFISGSILSAGSKNRNIEPAFNSGYASGTDFASPGWHMVGEEGPEMMYFKGGEKVLNSQDTKAAGGLTVNIGTFVNNRQQDVQSFAEELEFYRKRSSLGIGG